MQEKVEAAYSDQVLLLADLIRNDLLAGNLKEARLKLARSTVRSSIIAVDYQIVENAPEQLFARSKGAGHYVKEISVPVEFTPGQALHGKLGFKVDTSAIHQSVKKLNRLMTSGLILTTAIVAIWVVILLLFLLRSSLFLENYIDSLLHGRKIIFGNLDKFWQPMLQKFGLIAEQHRAVNLLINEIELENQDAAVLHQMMHDLNSPLTAIKVGLSKLQKSDVAVSLALSGAEKIEKLVSQAIANKKRVKNLVYGQVVDLALDQALAGLLPILRCQDERAVITLSIEPQRPVISAVNPVEFEGIVCNLVRNAIQASALPAEIHIVLKTTENFNYIIVADRGSGMAPELVANLGRVPITKDKLDLESGGTGQGLYNAFSVVRSWGGEIRISSKLNQGTQIAIAIPIAKAFKPN